MRNLRVYLLGVVSAILLACCMSVPTQAASTTTTKKAVFTIKEYKATWNGDKITRKYEFHLPQLKGSSDAVKKINKSLKKLYSASLNDKKAVWEYAEEAEQNEYLTDEDTYYSTCTCKVTYNGGGYVSFRFFNRWYAGGVGNTWVEGMSFDLKTGKKLNVNSFVEGSATQVKNKIINAYLNKVNDAEYAKEALEEFKISNFEYYLKEGRVHVCFGPYQPGGGNGHSEIVLVGNYYKHTKVTNPTKVILENNRTYFKYDVTGDGKSDTVKISLSKGEYFDYDGITIRVNDKVVYKKKADMYYCDVVLFTLKNGKAFLGITTSAENGDGAISGILQYKSGKIQQIVDFTTFLRNPKDYGYHFNGEVLKVKGNRIYTKQYLMSITLGHFVAEICYEYKNGTLKRTSNSYDVTEMWADGKNGDLFKASKKIKAYKTVKAEKIAFTVPKGKSVKVVKCYHNGKKMLFKVRYNGKYGWIKAISDGQIFSNVVLAG